MTKMQFFFKILDMKKKSAVLDMKLGYSLKKFMYYL